MSAVAEPPLFRSAETRDHHDTPERATLVMDCDRFFCDSLRRYVLADDQPVWQETCYARLLERAMNQSVGHVVAELYTRHDAPIDALLSLLRLRAYRPALPITVMTDIVDPAVLAALHSLGTLSLLSKRETLPQLALAYRYALTRPHVSPRIVGKIRHHPAITPMTFPEWKVVAIRSRGGDTYQIADYLGIHHKSVNYRQRGIMRKLAFASKPEYLRFLGAMSASPLSIVASERDQQHVSMGAIDEQPR